MAYFKHQPAPFANISKYDGLVNKEFITSFDEIMSGTKDINSALREAEERANKAISDAKSAK
jgi:hypothetical protein